MICFADDEAILVCKRWLRRAAGCRRGRQERPRRPSVEISPPTGSEGARKND